MKIIIVITAVILMTWGLHALAYPKLKTLPPKVQCFSGSWEDKSDHKPIPCPFKVEP